VALNTIKQTGKQQTNELPHSRRSR